jgi:hypothetical protein
MQYAVGGAFGLASFSGRVSVWLSRLAMCGLALSAIFLALWSVAFIGLLAGARWARRLALAAAWFSLVDAVLWGVLWAMWPSQIAAATAVLVIGWSTFVIMAMSQSTQERQPESTRPEA